MSFLIQFQLETNLFPNKLLLYQFKWSKAPISIRHTCQATCGLFGGLISFYSLWLYTLHPHELFAKLRESESTISNKTICSQPKHKLE